MGILRLRYLWYTLSGLLMIVSILAMVVYGFRFGIDFTGGTLLEVHFTGERPAVSVVEETLQPLNLGETQIEPANDDSYIIKTQFIQDDQRVAILQALGDDVVEDSFETIGPTIGEELRRKAISAVVLVVVAIVLYIAWAFRGVSKGPVPAWAFGLSAVVALIHDIIIPLGVFVVLGEWLGVELNVMFITALLTILGFSVHDTIVVFDRIRENLRRSSATHFAGVIGESIQQTVMRSLNTSVTVIIVLAVLLLFGGASTFYFVLALMIGITVGTYSSIFIASPSLLIWQKLLKKG
ncbi:MAG: protein translocase subunit SecF [Candidatus Kerfeldbacteria bacterium]|nr:protein translocase subunit SecF [Candidatus Kerfeldbacteria bacterium]